ncbi:Uncharacterized conserved protein, DUF1697 family [Streptoalloteichus tenebrarius]|uniref:Uncharacterized conserved protein, DUF1697 family n=1 Tax=Streptoalloteichus tenebrarius (strain ATCC 17920 / DSM 40477 / JCM 4838 / CBS 697.72 / NBRC 16177 / NCIMB 11028 / NRRL B-12390 / A12253. 1 / ISP 5477) TaxID=1933 RepID=A0ABT1HPW8_STRSD|nr:DUF1697 domain-containing protein [Streptoalloteichus tenebrarius]MCP2257568.1 Uncharacterized conserved protein, DUF1697 family [Streptoalloteichus tenebrarius]BFE98522.1 DUF1697 domain-containing protein [Streptoalloteichus tenebrarius]
MTRFVALLRGINVGGRQKVAMADLRAVLAGLGHTEVRTHLQSGNAVFTAPDRPTDEVATEIERAIHRELDLTVKVMVRTAEELRAVVEGNPLEVGDPARFLVSFLDRAPDPALLDTLDPAAYAPEQVRLGARELYLSLPDGIHRARLPQVLDRLLKAPATARNWNTVTKLLAMAEDRA